MATEWYCCAAVWGVLVVAFLFRRRRPSQWRPVPRWFALLTIGFVLGMGLIFVGIQFVGHRLEPATSALGKGSFVRNVWRSHYSQEMVPEAPPSEAAR